ncbi:serine hydrolase domain-containing protein [Aquimarina algiphila]|uniref:serine hydrolase domain-containing protein n=1 Tax=Aquimarina algiphila TaxID=2047982 RepID=UPI00232B4DBB|nr:serine hydrolase [Aquimarina algiphila]
MKGIISLLVFLFVYMGFSQGSIDALDKTLNSIYEKGHLPGFAVALVTPSGITFQKGYGYANKETKEPYTIETVQNIGSVSKTFIGVALMKAIELEKLTLDMPINEILPFAVNNPKYPDVPITVKHLATHTSSILDTENYNKSYVFENLNEITPEKFEKNEYKELKVIAKNKRYALKDFLINHLTKDGLWYSKKNFLKNRPGERYEYSNSGSALLAYIIEEATGVPFVKFTQEYILNPIEMSASGWSYTAIDKSKHAKTYYQSGNKVPEYSLITYPDGGFRTSITDLSKYLNTMMKGYYGEESSILKKNSYEKMMTPKLTKKQYNTKELKDNQGLLWESKPSGTIGHNGSDPGIFTLMYFKKQDRAGGIIFTNTDIDGNIEASESIQQIWIQIRKYQKENKK